MKLQQKMSVLTLLALGSLVIGCQKQKIAEKNYNTVNSRVVNNYTTLEVEIPTAVKNFQPNSSDYLHLYQEQLPNNNFAQWSNHPSSSVTSSLKNHPTFWSSPRFAKVKSGSNYSINTLYALVDDGTLLTKGDIGPEGTNCLKMKSKKSLLANIPGQISNAGLFADGSNEYQGFVATNNFDTEWSSATPFKSRPNAMEITFKYSPATKDKAIFEVMLHQGDGKFNPNKLDTRLPAQYPGNSSGVTNGNYKPVDANVIGYAAAKVPTPTVGSGYYKASLLIRYKDQHTTPDFVIVNLTSSDAYNILNNSTLEVCKVEFVYHY